MEGNSSDMVSRRVYAPQALNIAGYGRPNWALAANGGAAGSSPAAPPASAAPETPVRYAPYEYDVKIALPMIEFTRENIIYDMRNSVDA